MRRLKCLPLCLLLVLTLTTGAFAAEVPESFVTENLNGQQRLVKTYVLSPDIDPETLKEPSFEYDGFLYSWAYTVKEDHPYVETRAVTETVSVETAKDDLSEILESLAPSLSYNKDGFTGELKLDHTTLFTEASGYTTKYGKSTETKVISGLDRNDMSYVPATTVKNGRTLNLSNVDWQITGTALVGESLMPSQFQAVATYSVSTSWQAATGYVTTAEYKGEVTAIGIKDITYTVVYTGSKIVPASAMPEVLRENMAWIIGVALLFLIAATLLFFFRRRKNVYIYIPGNSPREYKLVAKFRVEAQTPSIDISEVDLSTSETVAVEVKRPLAKKLLGEQFTVHHQNGVHSYQILRDKPGDWHEFTLKPETDTLADAKEAEESL